MQVVLINLKLVNLDVVEWDGSVVILVDIPLSLVLVCLTSVLMVVMQDALAASSAAAHKDIFASPAAQVVAVHVTLVLTAVLMEFLVLHMSSAMTTIAGTSKCFHTQLV